MQNCACEAANQHVLCGDLSSLQHLNWLSTASVPHYLQFCHTICATVPHYLHLCPTICTKSCPTHSAHLQQRHLSHAHSFVQVLQHQQPVRLTPGISHPDGAANSGPSRPLGYRSQLQPQPPARPGHIQIWHLCGVHLCLRQRSLWAAAGGSLADGSPTESATGGGLVCLP